MEERAEPVRLVLFISLEQEAHNSKACVWERQREEEETDGASAIVRESNLEV